MLIRAALFSAMAAIGVAQPAAQPQSNPTPPPIIPSRGTEAPVIPSNLDLPGKAKIPETAPGENPLPETPLFPEYLPGERPPSGRRAPAKPRPAPELERLPEQRQPEDEERDRPEVADTLPKLDPAERLIQRTAMSQAFSTGEALLGDLSGLRGEVDSPFLPTGRTGVPAFRFGKIDIYPRLTVGVSAMKSEGAANTTDLNSRLRTPTDSTTQPQVSGTGNTEDSTDQEEVEGFFQAGFSAVLREQGHFSASLNYGVGLSPQSGSQGGQGGGEKRKLDQQLSLGGSFLLPPIPRIQFGFGLSFTGLSGTNRDVGGPAERDIATFSLTASYQYTPKTSFNWDVSLPVRQFTGGVSSSGPTSTLSINNQITKKSQVGLMLTVGSLSTEVLEDPSSSPDGRDGTEDPTSAEGNANDAENGNGATQPLSKGQEGLKQTFERVMFRVNTSPTPRFSFDGTGGVEFRTAGGQTTVGPTFGLGATWRPSIATTVNLAAESRIFNSAAELNTNFTSTSVSLRLTQRIGYRLTAGLTAGYEHAVYESVGEERQSESSDPIASVPTTDPFNSGRPQGAENGRVDDLFRISLDLSVPITQRWNCGLTLSAYKNESEFMPFESYQAILQTTYAF